MFDFFFKPTNPNKKLSLSELRGQSPLRSASDTFSEGEPVARESQDEDIRSRAICDPNNPASPFAKFMDNDEAKGRLARAAYAARLEATSGNQNFALYGPKSVGKTTLAEIYAEAVGDQLFSIHPRSYSSPDELAKGFIHTAGFMAYEDLVDHVTIPPMVALLDEAHSHKASMVDVLLKATEKSDATLQTTDNKVFDLSNVCWFLATTERAMIPDPLASRFSEIFLEPLSRSSIAQLIKNKFDNLSDEACELIGKYTRPTPREAQDFAREVESAKLWSPETNWKELVLQVAKARRIDEHGLHAISLNILRQLKDGPVYKNRLPAMLRMRQDDLEGNWMPELMSDAHGQEPLVEYPPNGKGYQLTQAGVEALALRGE